MSKSQSGNAHSSSENQISSRVRRIGQSCKALFCCIFITGAILNIALTFILLFSVENYHQVDHIKLYEVFESRKYAETNKLLDREKYLVLHGDPSSGIINFVEHEANLRLQEGVPVIMRDLQQSFINKKVKETKHFVELYLGQVGRGKHTWFIVLNNTETPDNQIKSIQKKYPRDSIILIAHQSLQIENFKSHKFPVLSSGELRQFMQQILKMDKKQIKRIFENTQDKTAAAIFEAYKNNQEKKIRAQQAKQALTNANQVSKSNTQNQKQEMESSKNKQNKKGKKDKQTKKTKKNKKTQQIPEQEDQQPVAAKKQKKVKKQKKNQKKDKNEKKSNQKQQKEENKKEDNQNKKQKTKKKAEKIEAVEFEDKKQKKDKKKAEDKQEKAEKSDNKKVKGKKADKKQEKKEEVVKQSALEKKEKKTKVAVQASVITPPAIINEEPIPALPIINSSETGAISSENISIGIQKIAKEVISQVFI